MLFAKFARFKYKIIFMKNTVFTPRFWFVTALIAGTAISRLLLTGYNFTPVGAMALFAGAYFGRKQFAFAIPLIAMFLTDLVLGLHSTMIFVYSAFALSVVLGIALQNKNGVIQVLAGSIGSATGFFLITNFGVWLTQLMPYPMNWQGLMICYFEGLPFYRADLISTTVFSTVLFGAFYLAQRRFPVLVKA